MKVDKTYKITLDSGEVFTGKFEGFRTTAYGNAGIVAGNIFWLDEVESINPVGYNYVPTSRHVSKIGVPHGQRN